MPINYSEYPDDWKQISEYIRFVRANNKCETCGVPNYELIYRPESNDKWELAPEGHLADAIALDGVKFSKIVLTVAHIKPDKHDVRFNIDKYDPEDEENNLVAECQRCHLKRDGQLHAMNRKYGRNWKKNQTKLEL